MIRTEGHRALHKLYVLVSVCACVDGYVCIHDILEKKSVCIFMSVGLCM